MAFQKIPLERAPLKRPPRARRSACAIISALVFIFANALSLPAVGGEENRIHWKQVPEAQVKLDDKTPLTWAVYQPVKDKKGKKKDSTLALVLLGRRYLLLDLKTKKVYQVAPSDLQAQGEDFESGDLASKSQVIPTTDWISRDVGPAELYQLTLGDYGRVLQVSLPHPLELIY